MRLWRAWVALASRDSWTTLPGAPRFRYSIYGRFGLNAGPGRAGPPALALASSVPHIPRLTHRDDDEVRVNAAPGEAPLAGHLGY